MEYWNNYNRDLEELAEVMLTHNSFNQFNFIESSFYNHVHDILALSLLHASKGSRIKVLDYGSNILPWSNLINKINTKLVDIFIYDPFFDQKYLSRYPKLNLRISNNIKNFEVEDFDLVIYGSSSQYIKNFLEDILNKTIYSSKYVLFTHTPLSLKESFISNQYTGFKGIQYIRSFNKLKSKMESDGYGLIFKSILPLEMASVDKDKEINTIYANLLFERN